MNAPDANDLLMTPAAPEPNRDRWGRYLLPHPATGETKAWTRATTFASSIADTFGLSKWQNRMTAIGMGMRPDLLAQVQGVTDPDSSDGKRKIGQLAEQAQEHAGSRTGANLGTALHTFAEHVDTGRKTLAEIPAVWQGHIEAYRTAMADGGVTTHPEWVERIVVVPELEVVGTLDRLNTVDGALVVGDLKTGKDLSYSWGEIAIQLALYAHAEAMWDWQTESWQPMPTVDLDRALVFHVSATAAPSCALYQVDIASAWATAVPLAAGVRAWRKRRDLANKLRSVTPDVPAGDLLAPAPTTDDTLVADLEASLTEPFTTSHEQAKADAAPVTDLFASSNGEPVKLGDVLPGVVADLDPTKKPAPVEDLFATRAPAEQPPVDPEVEAAPDCVDLFATPPKPEPEPAERDDSPANSDRARWMFDRCKALQPDQRARELLAMRWPGHVVAPAGWGTWTVSDLDDIAAVLVDIEASIGAPFPETSDPSIERPEPEPQPERTPPLPTPNETNGKVDPAELAAGEAAAQALPTHKFAWGARWRQQHKLTGRTWPRGTSRRGFAVATAAIACLTHLWDDDDPDALTRAAVATVLDLDRLPDGWETGAILGSLSTPQADRLTQLAEAAASDEAVLGDLALRVTAA